VLRLVASVDFFLVPFVVCFFVAALCNRAGNYVFALWFLLLSIFSSSPNLSRRGLHSTHGVALVRILDAGLKRAARGSLKVQDAKNRQKFAMGTVAQICLAISSQLRHVSTIGKNFLDGNISSTCPHNMVNFGPLAAEIGSVVWHRSKFQRVSRLGFLTARHSSHSQWAPAKLCGVEQRAPPMFGRAAITLGLGPHSSC